MNRCIVDASQTQWDGCYDAGWQGEIVPEAFAHPAKVSRALIRRIYEHAFTEGWLRAGDTVVDPFGGIAGTAIDAVWNGLNWVGVELEPRFVGLAQQNIELWQRKYGSKLGFGSARIVQGDSRQLVNVIQPTACVISSPPFLECHANGVGVEATARQVTAERVKSKIGYGFTDGQLGAMKEGEPPQVDCVVSSPPYVSGGHHPDQTGAWNTSEKYDGRNRGLTKEQAGYGRSEGQMGQMPEGNIDAVISSPPYAAVAAGAGGLNTKPGKDGQQTGRDPDSPSQSTDQHYGESTGQLSAMAEGAFDAVVSLPPFEGVPSDKPSASIMASGLKMGKSSSGDGYGETTGNIGNQSGGTFWQAARDIVAQCHAILRPNGHAIWICKDFVRKGKRIPFSDQWQALCESQGFRLVCRHRAMLIAHYGEQDGLFGAATQVKTERKSFFRRLAEAKGSPPIDWEDVICFSRERAAQTGTELR